MTRTIRTSVESVKPLDENKFKHAFGQQIKGLRAAHGWSQTDLGKRAGGLTAAAISAWEKGKTAPDLLSLIRISRALEMEPDALLVTALEATLPELRPTDVISPARRESLLHLLFRTVPTDDEEAMVSDAAFQKVWQQVKALYFQHKRDKTARGWNRLSTFLDWLCEDLDYGGEPPQTTSRRVTPSGTRGGAGRPSAKDKP